MKKKRQILIIAFFIFIILSVHNQVKATTDIEELPDNIGYKEYQADVINSGEDIESIRNTPQKYNSNQGAESLDTRIYNALITGSASFSVEEYNMTIGEISKYIQYMIIKYPETYVLKSWTIFYNYTNSIATKIKPNYFIDTDSIQMYYHQAEFVANNFVETVPKDSTDLEKIIYIHNYICSNTEYDFENLNNNTLPDIVHTMYGFFRNQKTVCDGYSATFNYLAKKLNLESSMVTSATMSHAWNIVKIGNNYYHLDLTWDDEPYGSIDIYGQWNYKYFLLSDAGMLQKEHYKWYSEQNCNNTDYDNSFFSRLSGPIIEYKNSWFYLTYKNNQYLELNYRNNIESSDSNISLGKLESNDSWPVILTDGNDLYYTNGNYIYNIEKLDNGIISVQKISTLSEDIRGFRFFNGRFRVQYFPNRKAIVDLPSKISIGTKSGTVQDFNLNPINVGETYKINAINANLSDIKSSNEKVITVSNGIVKAVGSGNANIILTNSNKTVKIPVCVKDTVKIIIEKNNDSGNVIVNGNTVSDKYILCTKGAKVNIKVVANNNAKINKFSIDGKLYSNYDVTFDKLEKDITVTVNFEKSYTRKQIEDLIFDYKFYADKYSDLKRVFGYNQTALKNHWINCGIKEGRQGSAVFDAKYYLYNNDDLKKAFNNNLEQAYNHFVNNGWKEGRPSSSEFFVNYYRNNNKDLQNMDNYELMQHYNVFGRKEGRRGNNLIDKTPVNIKNYLFDYRFYADTNADLKRVFGYNQTALKNHWINCGIKEGRQASVVFNVRDYLNYYSDLKNVFKNNYEAAYNHFVNSGINEGRKSSKLFDVNYYLNNNSDLKKAFGNNYSKALQHFASNGIKEGRNASSTFKVTVYKSKNLDLQRAFGNDNLAYYIHYINCGYRENRIVY